LANQACACIISFNSESHLLSILVPSCLVFTYSLQFLPDNFVQFFSLTLAVSKIISEVRGLIFSRENNRLHRMLTYPFLQHTIGVNLRLMSSHCKAIFFFLWSLDFWTLLLQLCFGNIAYETRLKYYFYVDYALSQCSSFSGLSLLSVTPLSMLLSPYILSVNTIDNRVLSRSSPFMCVSRSQDCSVILLMYCVCF